MKHCPFHSWITRLSRLRILGCITGCFLAHSLQSNPFYSLIAPSPNLDVRAVFCNKFSRLDFEKCGLPSNSTSRNGWDGSRCRGRCHNSDRCWFCRCCGCNTWRTTNLWGCLKGGSWHMERENCWSSGTENETVTYHLTSLADFWLRLERDLRQLHDEPVPQGWFEGGSRIKWRKKKHCQ